MNVLLDTCALLWLASGDRKLSKQAHKRICESPIAYVSAISGFEISLKYRKGNLHLPAEPVEWFSTIVDHHGLTVIPLDYADAIQAPLLPEVHRDPCDRFILAAALRMNLPVATADAQFKEYGIEVFC